MPASTALAPTLLPVELFSVELVLPDGLGVPAGVAGGTTGRAGSWTPEGLTAEGLTFGDGFPCEGATGFLPASRVLETGAAGTAAPETAALCFVVAVGSSTALAEARRPARLRGTDAVHGTVPCAADATSWAPVAGAPGSTAGLMAAAETTELTAVMGARSASSWA